MSKQTDPFFFQNIINKQKDNVLVQNNYFYLSSSQAESLSGRGVPRVRASLGGHPRLGRGPQGHQGRGE